jgi:hypothetical protein
MNADPNTSRFADTSLRTAAIVAGLGLLIMAILAPIANFGLLQNLVVPGDATSTANNIAASAGPFRVGIFLFLIVAILDVVVAWALYILLSPVSTGLSLLAAWFRLAYAVMFASALNNLLIVLQLLNGSDYLRAVPTDQLHAQVLSSVNAFISGWDIGLVVFGLHLLVLGYLALKSGYIPRIIGILLIIAGLGYLVDNVGKLLSPHYTVTISTFTFIGEVLFILWLLWRGFRGFDKGLEKTG